MCSHSNKLSLREREGWGGAILWMGWRRRFLCSIRRRDSSLPFVSLSERGEIYRGADGCGSSRKKQTSTAKIRLRSLASFRNGRTCIIIIIFYTNISFSMRRVRQHSFSSRSRVIRFPAFPPPVTSFRTKQFRRNGDPAKDPSQNDVSPPFASPHCLSATYPKGKFS